MYNISHSTWNTGPNSTFAAAVVVVVVGAANNRVDTPKSPFGQCVVHTLACFHTNTLLLRRTGPVGERCARPHDATTTPPAAAATTATSPSSTCPGSTKRITSTHGLALPPSSRPSEVQSAMVSFACVSYVWLGFCCRCCRYCCRCCRCCCRCCVFAFECRIVGAMLRWITPMLLHTIRPSVPHVWHIHIHI